ncbi:MAG TPA: alpha-xylosidase [Polyangiaceae bacterium]|nr:alpha-xylosidase [Polyangiaceae bacterium]
MKFSHGVWTMREGVSAIYPERVADHRMADGALELTCLNRGPEEKLNAYALSVRLSSPMPDVVRVRVSHRQGAMRRRPSFVLNDQANALPIALSETESELSLSSGQLTAKIARRPFELTFCHEGRTVTRSAQRALGVMKVAGSGEYLMQRLSLGVGECVYGLGERFGPLLRNGQSVPIWNEDPGTATDLAYKNVPFYLTSAGYGVFVASPGRLEFEVGTERTAAVQFSSAENELDYFVIFGPTPREVLEKYTRLTGRAALPPSWSFGLWLSTSFLTDYDERIVTEELLQGMVARDIPVSVFHYDCAWMREHHWCDFQWDPDKFPDPPGMLRRLHERGLRVSVWINPYVSELSSLFAEGRDRGFFLKNRKGEVYQRDDWQPGIALVDFTNPDAVSWYQGALRRLLEMGVDCFKTDFGERIPDDAVYFDGSDPERMHNFYPYLYNEAVFSLLEQFHGKGKAVVFARSATAGSQKFPVHWGGDCDSTFESMAETLRGGLSYAMSGGAFWSHDIGGFSGTAPPALYKRWVAFGLLSSHSRLHGSTSYRVPWSFDEESVDVLRFFTHLKHRLMPYLWSCAHEAYTTGMPMMRAMVLEFPDDPACRYLDRQYMLGGELLVAPIFNEEGSVDYYLPHGTWTDFFTGRRIEGGRFFQERGADFLRIPLFVRPGTLLAVGLRHDCAVYDYRRGVMLHAFELVDGSRRSIAIPDSEGQNPLSFHCQRDGARIVLSSSGDNAPRILLHGDSEHERVVNGSVERHPDGLLVSWTDPALPLEIVLANSPS